MGESSKKNLFLGGETRIPLWSLPNCFSLDAVLVGLIWQCVFTWQFCERLPKIFELSIIGLSIWLVYTADRLLDSRRLDLGRPHTLRHRVHCELRKPLILTWLAVLSINITLILNYADEAQLRWGIVAIAVSVAYVVVAQVWRQSIRWFPKELLVGAIFTFGVSLTAWSERPAHTAIPMLISCGMAALLFASNCMAIAFWERDLDRLQQIDSIASRASSGVVGIVAWVAVHLLAVMTLWFFHTIPLSIAVCMVLSNMLLLALLVIRNGGPVKSLIAKVSLAECDLRVVLADFALVTPPLAIFVLGRIIE